MNGRFLHRRLRLLPLFRCLSSRPLLRPRRRHLPPSPSRRRLLLPHRRRRRLTEGRERQEKGRGERSRRVALSSADGSRSFAPFAALKKRRVSIYFYFLFLYFGGAFRFSLPLFCCWSPLQSPKKERGVTFRVFRGVLFIPIYRTITFIDGTFICLYGRSCRTIRIFLW